MAMWSALEVSTPHSRKHAGQARAAQIAAASDTPSEQVAAVQLLQWAAV